MLNVLLAEDHNIVRNGVKMLLETDRSIDVVGEAVNGLEALETVKSGKKIDVVLADINMPELDGMSLIAEINKISPETKVIILSMHSSDEYVAEAFLKGAAGYLIKNISADELVFAIKHVCAGNRYLCAEIAIRMFETQMSDFADTPVNHSSKIDFSSREIEVLHLIAEGLTNSEMSEKLFISKRTIEGHRQSLIDKTGSRNTAALIKYAVQMGIVH
ncbi:MAG: response regulator transcription factor [Pedobacter sp.]|nr:MAG: response regulator transcription factor [Pedobacter sp.]